MQSLTDLHFVLEQKHKWYADWHTISRFKYYHWSFFIALSLLVGTTVVDQVNRTYSLDIPTSIVRVSAVIDPTPSLGTNLAPSGTAYRWHTNATSTTNANKAIAAGLNDNNLNTDVHLNGGSAELSLVF